MRFLEVLEYLGGEAIVQNIAGEFADLLLLSQQVESGVIVIQRNSTEMVIAFQNGTLALAVEITGTEITPLEFEDWTTISIDPSDKVTLLEIPISLVHLLLGTLSDEDISSVIASQVPLALAIQLIERKAESGTYQLCTEYGTLLLRIDEAGRKVVWVGQPGIIVGQEAIDLALNTYSNSIAVVSKVSVWSDEGEVTQSQSLLDLAQAVWTEERDATKAIELAQQAVLTLPLEARRFISDVYRAGGQYGKAIEELETLVQQGMATEEIYGRLARLYDDQDKVVQAVKVLQSAKEEADIDSLQILRYLVALYTKRQMVTELIETLDEIISRCEVTTDDQSRETLHWAMHRKGLALMLRGDARQSLVFLERAIELLPEDIGPYQDLSRAYRELGSQQEAISSLRQALEVVTNPEDKIKVLNSIAHIQMSLQHYQDAANSYYQILELDSGNLGALLQLGLIYYRTGDVEKARGYFEKAAEVSPDNPMAQNYLVKLQSKPKTRMRTPSGPREEVHLRDPLDASALFALLHSRVKREIQSSPGKSDEELPVDGWTQYYECIKGGERLKRRTDCFREIAQLAKDANDPTLFVLAVAQYCQLMGFFQFRYRGDHQAARHVYYRSLVRLLGQMVSLPRSVAKIYHSVINNYLFSCVGVKETPGYRSSTDTILGDILQDSGAKAALKEEIAFWIEEHPALLLEVTNWLQDHRTEFVNFCVKVIGDLLYSKPYEAFSALLRLDREPTYFAQIVYGIDVNQAVSLARALIDFSDPTATAKSARRKLPRFVEALNSVEWADEVRQSFAYEVLCYRRTEPEVSLHNLRRNLFRTVLQFEKRRGEEVFLEKVFAIGGTLARFQMAQTPQDKYLYGKQTESELQKAYGYVPKLQHSRRGLANSLLTRIRNSVEEGIADISVYPQVDLDLTTSRLPYSEEVRLYFTIRNTGFGPAEDVRMRVSETDQFIVSEMPQTISVLSADKDTTWELKIRPLIPPGELTLSATVSWRNVQKREDSKDFEFVVSFYPEEEFRKIPQRYIPGKPIQDPAMFYGRAGILEEIVNNLKGLSQDNVLVLYGQRRVGKTSLLYRLQSYDLRGPYVPVFIDMQELSGSSTARLCSKLANSVLNELKARGISVPVSSPLPSAHFGEDPLGKLGEFFDKIETLQDVRILLLIDEFESLMLTIREGTITEHFYNFLRGLMQHKTNVSFIFAGADELQNMMRDYASIMFNIARFIPMGYMSSEEAEYLIRKPVEGFLVYNDAAVDRIKMATSGNPYYIQLICFNLVERMNREKRNIVTIVDVNEVIKELLRFGSSYFEHLWRRSEPLENILLACLAELADPSSDRWVQYIEILERMRQIEERYGTNLSLSEEGTLLKVTKTLRDRGVLEERRREEEIDFRIRIDLFREWFGTYQPLERTVKELLADA